MHRDRNGSVVAAIRDEGNASREGSTRKRSDLRSLGERRAAESRVLPRGGPVCSR